jgi:hypothetical protein
MPDDKPGNGFLGWLGRQVGHVKKAIKTDVTKPQQQPQPQQPRQPQPQQQPGPPVVPTVVYRDEKAEEVELPHQPGVVLRRTVIDEVVVDPAKAQPPPQENQPQ